MLVRGGWVVPAHDKPAIRDGVIIISGDKIIDVGPYELLSDRYRGEKTELGGSRYLVIPGLVNGHSHGRGLSDFQRGGLDNTLESWRFNAHTYTPVPTHEDVVFSAIKLVKAGVTTTMHNHSLRGGAIHSEDFEAAIKAYQDVGMRVHFTPGVRNANPYVYGDNELILNSLSEKTRRTLSARDNAVLDTEYYFRVVKELHQQYQSPFITIGFGPTAPQWCTSDLLRQIKRESDKLNVPIHLHTLQTVFQKIYSLKSYGKSYIAYLHDLGVLDKNLVLGHCVFPTEEDIALMATHQTGVTHHPSCNLRVRNGIGPVYDMLRAGVNVGLGMDGKTLNDDDDMFHEMKVCRLLHHVNSMELDSPCLTNREILKMATENSASLIGFASQIGRLEPGRLADLVLLDYQAMTYPYTHSSHDPVDVLLYRADSRQVDTVIIHGKVVVKNGTVLTVDEKRIATVLTEAASQSRTTDEIEYNQAIKELRARVCEYFNGWTDKVHLEPYYTFNSKLNGLK